MKKAYIEYIPVQKIKHNIIICDNKNCEIVIEDNDILLTEHYQIGNGKKLLDACSEKCRKILEREIKEAKNKLNQLTK